MIVAVSQADRAQLFDHAGVSVGERSARRVLAPPVDVATPGHMIDVSWTLAAGATTAEVTAATLTLGPDVAEEVTASAGFHADGKGWVVDVSENRRVRALGLSGFKGPEGSELAGDLGGRRIVVAFPRAAGGFDAPRFAVPAVGRQNAIPSSLLGASFVNASLTLDPSVAARKVRIALVDGASPAAFTEVATELAAVRLVTHVAAQDLKVLGPDGAVLWTTPEFDPDAVDADIDLGRALSAAFTAALAAGQPPIARVTITATAPARTRVAAGRVHGVLVRTLAGVTKVTLEGAPVTMKLTPPIAAEIPSRVTADLRLRYADIRLVPDLSDPTPAAGAPAGRIVTPGGGSPPGMLRPLPPRALQGESVARLGLRGRAAEPTELTVELVDAATGAPMGPAAVLMLQPGPIAYLWAVFAKPVAIDRAAAVRVRAKTGRFLWANGPAGAPSLLVAVADPDPGGRPIRIGGATLAPMSTPVLEIKAATIPAQPFAGAAPLLQSELFVTVEFADLRLEYAR